MGRVLFSLMLFGVLSHAQNGALSSDDRDLAFRLEGVYEIEGTYTHFDGERETRLDRLVVWRNEDDEETLSIAFAVSRFNFPVFLFSKARIEPHSRGILLTAEGVSTKNIYGEIKVIVDSESLNLEVSFVDSISPGVQEFTGVPIYNINDCLYLSQDPTFRFPDLEDLVGEYEDEEGNLLLLRSYSSGAISLVIKKPMSDGSYVHIAFSRGKYYLDRGLLGFTWQERGTQGKLNVAYRLDEEGIPYLKSFSMNSGGRSYIRKFYYKGAILPLPNTRGFGSTVIDASRT